MTSIMWRRMDGTGLERSQITEAADSVRLSGTSLLSTEGGPVEIRYSIALDHLWKTSIVGVTVQGPDDERSVALRADGHGDWAVGDEIVAELHGAIDVDFAWTPATNTIPIRRLVLDVGATGEVHVIHVPYPARDVAIRTQTYERLGPRRYRFTSGDYQTDLTVDDRGVVEIYPGQWTAV
jgi:hypothetical protein